MKHRRSLIAVIFTALASLLFASCNHNLPDPMYGPAGENLGQETQNSTSQDSDDTEIPE